MGCTTSKQAQWDRQSKARASRSYSLPHHRISESYHAASLCSSTLESLKLETIEALEQNLCQNEILDQAEEDGNNKKKCNELAEFSMEVFRAKVWSNKIEEKIPRKPKTPNLTPPNEPEVINTWELMEGLEDNSPIRISTLDRSFSFHTYFDPETEIKPKGGSSSPILESASASPKPARLQINSNDSVVTDFDPEVISTFRKALKDISPERVCSLRSPEREKQPTFPASPKDDLSNKIGFVKARVSDFQKKIDAKKCKVAQLHSKCPPQGEDRVVFYFTSLRGVRKTYEDCCNVRMILKGSGVRVDERDVSMHSGFREELNEVLEEGERRSLPKLFVKGRYLGGADEVRQLHEAGELEKILEGCEMVEDGGSVCEACGNVRFINCERCFGSCKLYYEEEEDEDEDEDKDRDEDEDGDGGGFQRCPDCNENGIIRCPVCCY